MAPSLSADQLADRPNGIGASEAAMALGLSPFGGPAALQARKLGAAEPEEPTWAMRLGSIFEAAIAEAVSERTGWWLTGFHRTLWHPNGVMFATPDFRITGERSGLEVKKSERGEEWGDDGDPLGAPVHVRVQVQHQMACLPTWERVWVGCLLYGRDLRLYPVERNPGQIAHLETALPEWWQRHIVEREPIEPDGSPGSEAAIRALYPHATEEPRPATPEEDLIALELLAVSAIYTEADKRRDLLRQRLMAAMGAAGAVVGEGWKATFGDQRGRVDYRKAAEATGLTEIEAEAYRAEPSRVLRVTAVKAEGKREAA
jgi:predicted phage-related endonuclease